MMLAPDEFVKYVKDCEIMKAKPELTPLVGRIVGRAIFNPFVENEAIGRKITTFDQLAALCTADGEIPVSFDRGYRLERKDFPKAKTDFQINAVNEKLGEPETTSTLPASALPPRPPKRSDSLVEKFTFSPDAEDDIPTAYYPTIFNCDFLDKNTGLPGMVSEMNETCFVRSPVYTKISSHEFVRDCQFMEELFTSPIVGATLIPPKQMETIDEEVTTFDQLAALCLPDDPDDEIPISFYPKTITGDERFEQNEIQKDTTELPEMVFTTSGLPLFLHEKYYRPSLVYPELAAQKLLEIVEKPKQTKKGRHSEAFYVEETFVEKFSNGSAYSTRYKLQNKFSSEEIFMPFEEYPCSFRESRVSARFN